MEMTYNEQKISVKEAIGRGKDHFITDIAELWKDIFKAKFEWPVRIV